MPLEKGTRLEGYEIIDRVGKGGMGDVYRARQESLDRIVALKVLPPELSHNKEFSERFKSEANVISLLEHHNIVAIYDFGEVNNLRFFAMQYVEGESLDQKIQREKTLKIEVAVEFSKQILRALRYAHAHKVIHRDIKPHNVLIDTSGKVFVSDFGIATIFANTRITNTGMAVGTPEYMSPEQSEGVVLDARSDIYSTGIVMYEMLSGAPPFTAENPLAVAYKQVNEQPKSPCEINKNIPQRVGLIILKALKKDKAQRYQSATEMLADLDSVDSNIKPSKVKTLSLPVVSKEHKEIVDQRITDRRMGDRRHRERRGFRDNDNFRIFAAAGALFLLSVLLVAIFFFFPAQSEKPVRHAKISATATSAAAGGETWNLDYLSDGNPTTAWAGCASANNAIDYVLFSFRRPMVLSRLLLYNGLQKEKQYTLYGRAKTIELSFSDGTIRRLTVKDQPGQQLMVLPMVKTSFLRIAILDSYSGSQYSITPLSEVTLWGMQAR
jgi:serine/threonine protein kinase